MPMLVVLTVENVLIDLDQGYLYSIIIVWTCTKYYL